MSCDMRFGTLANLKDFPAPKSGMGFGLNHDVTTSELVTGGRAAYRSPVGYKTFNMSWAGGTENLGDFMDIFEGAYGNGPYYMLDPRSKGQNLLPARWASPWMLGHVANGWGKPFVSQNGTTAYPESHDVTFTHGAGVPATKFNSPFSTTVLLEDGVNYNFRVWGVTTGGAQLRATAYNQGAAETPISLPLSSSGATSSAFNTYKGAVKLSLYLPAGSTLKLQHIELMTQPEVLRTNLATNPSVEGGATRWAPYGSGVTGAVVSGGALGSANSYLLTFPGGAGNQGRYSDTLIAATPGTVYTASLYVKPSWDCSLALRGEWRDATDVIPGTARTADPTFCPANQWTRLAVTLTTELAATMIRVQFWLSSTSAVAPAGGTVNLDCELTEEGVTAGTYFDGSTPPSNGKTYRWTGTPNNSASQEIVGDGKPFHMGRGVGAVQFTGNIQGNLVSSKVDRIGLSVEVTEVES